MVKKPTGTKPMLGGKVAKPVTSYNLNNSYVPKPPIIAIDSLDTKKTLKKTQDYNEDPLNETVEEENSIIDGSFRNNKKSSNNNHS